MSTVLKTSIRRLLDADMHYSSEILKHDALAAHAMQMAIEELEYSFRKALNERAAANLARLIAGDSSNTPDSARNGERNG